MAAEPSPTATISPATDSVAPPRVPLPRAAQGLGFLISRHAMMRWWHRRLGDAFVLDLPIFGDCVVISDPAHAKQLFTAGDKVHNVSPNLGRVLGDGSVFSLEGTDHRRRRKLLTPPLHGKRIKTYESIVEEETLAEIATWPQRRRFRSLEPMMHITLNIILRAVFGAAGKDLDDLRRIIPPLVAAGSLSATVPRSPGRCVASTPTTASVCIGRSINGLSVGSSRRPARTPTSTIATTSSDCWSAVATTTARR